MHWVKPKVFVIAETKKNSSGAMAYLEWIGAVANNAQSVSDDFQSDAKTGGEWLVEVAGRACYRSFKPGLNKNVKKIREGNVEYIGNILNQKHGSVLEHAYVTFACTNVSRIFTHELVRHRAGVAISQESGRYVRIDEIGMFRPECISTEWIAANFGATVPQHVLNRFDDGVDGWALTMQDRIGEVVEKVADDAAVIIKNICAELGMDEAKVPFHAKKEMTSTLRRLAPGGQTTSIIFTANHRAIRHMIAMRTAGGAEEEIRFVFADIAARMNVMYPALYQDMEPVVIEGSKIPVYVFKNEKV